MKLHHMKSEVCSTRAPYRDGTFPKGVKVYTVNQESKYLLVQGVPAIGVHTDLVKLFALYGTVLEYRLLDEYASEAITEVVWIKFHRIQESRIAKRKLDDYNFFGKILHVAYAPEYESVEETREKLKDRRKIIASNIRRLDEEKCAAVEERSTDLASPVCKSDVLSKHEPMTEDGSFSSFQRKSEINAYFSSFPKPLTQLPSPELFHRLEIGPDHLRNFYFAENSMPRKIDPHVMLTSKAGNDVGIPRQLYHRSKHCQNPAHESRGNSQEISAIQAAGIYSVKHSQPCTIISPEAHSCTLEHHLRWVREDRDHLAVALTKKNTEQFITELYGSVNKNHDIAISKDTNHTSTTSALPMGDMVLRDYMKTRVAAKFIPRQIIKRKSLPKEILVQANKTQYEKQGMKQTIKDSVSEKLRTNALILGNTEGPKQPENL